MPHSNEKNINYFALPLGKENSHIFFKFDLLNTDTFYGPLNVRLNAV